MLLLKVRITGPFQGIGGTSRTYFEISFSATDLGPDLVGEHVTYHMDGLPAPGRPPGALMELGEGIPRADPISVELHTPVMTVLETWVISLLLNAVQLQPCRQGAEVSRIGSWVCTGLAASESHPVCAQWPLVYQLTPLPCGCTFKKGPLGNQSLFQPTLSSEASSATPRRQSPFWSGFHTCSGALVKQSTETGPPTPVAEI